MRFVILHHTLWAGHADHYDLMLQVAAGEDENSRVLKTFSTLSDVFPTGEADLFRQAEDHRRLYLQYEGEIDGNRGRVARIDSGELTFLDPRAGVEELRFSLNGARIFGEFELLRAAGGLYRFVKSISRPLSG